MAQNISKTNFLTHLDRVKMPVATIKQKPGGKPGLADRKPVSTGRTIKVDREDNIATVSSEVK